MFIYFGIILCCCYLKGVCMSHNLLHQPLGSKIYRPDLVQEYLVLRYKYKGQGFVVPETMIIIKRKKIGVLLNEIYIF
ncbi:hypothetical protein ACJX0J_022184, partial [Zea mays]